MMTPLHLAHLDLLVPRNSFGCLQNLDGVLLIRKRMSNHFLIQPSIQSSRTWPSTGTAPPNFDQFGLNYRPNQLVFGFLEVHCILSIKTGFWLNFTEFYQIFLFFQKLADSVPSEYYDVTEFSLIPTQHILNLAWIQRYSSLRDNMTQESNLIQPKLTLAQFGIQPMFSKLLQN
jgi:hypothetical protein